MIFQNKKADASVTILVFLTLALCTSCLFYFYVSESSRETEIVSFGTLNDFYVYTDSLNYYIKNLATEIIVKNSSLDSDTFLVEFKKKLAISSGNFDARLFESMRKADYNVQIRDKTLYFNMKNFTLLESYERKNGGIYDIRYSRDVSFIIPFKSG